MNRLDKIEKVDATSAFKTDSDQSIDWLSQQENLDQLASTIGLKALHPQNFSETSAKRNTCILEGSEQEVVIIQHQWNASTAQHLGDIISLAAGAKASYLVWIAETFHPEHLAALQYLNSKTINHLHFFGVSMELWRSGEHQLIPKFELLLQPLNWTKGTSQNSPLASSVPIQQLQRKFWLALSHQLKSKAPHFGHQRARSLNWLHHPIRQTGFGLNIHCDSTSRILTVGLSMPDGQARSSYARLLANKLTIEEQLGFTLDWLEPPEIEDYGIVSTYLDVSIQDQHRWDEYMEWAVQRFVSMDKVFRPIVTDL